jgi:hypothetical protein
MRRIAAANDRSLSAEMRRALSEHVRREDERIAQDAGRR